MNLKAILLTQQLNLREIMFQPGLPTVSGVSLNYILQLRKKSMVSNADFLAKQTLRWGK